MSPRKGLTHKENYEYTMNRMKHIEEQGYKMMYIWITDFKRFTLDLEDSEQMGSIGPNLFDYMNIEKSYPREYKGDTKLLYKGSRKRLHQKGMLYCHHLEHDWQAILDCV